MSLKIIYRVTTNEPSLNQVENSVTKPMRRKLNERNVTTKTVRAFISLLEQYGKKCTPRMPLSRITTIIKLGSVSWSY